MDFDFSAAPATLDPTRLRTLSKSTGQVEDVILDAQGSDEWRLELVLKAGEPILFKYADGNPFAPGPR